MALQPTAPLLVLSGFVLGGGFVGRVTKYLTITNIFHAP
jgi:hypothetical protein